MSTTARLLDLLNLLQSRPTWTGTELAERLGVTTRSIRRDIERLRDLGYPVNAAQGAGGGYQLGAGRGLPPLLLSDDEAIAVAVSLRLAATGALSGASEPALRTLAKLDQVMPPRLRQQVRAIRDATETLGATDSPVDGDLLLQLARASRDRMRVRFHYASRGGDASERTVEPVRLVTTGRRWYLMAWDELRADWRTFRLDRMSRAETTTWGFRPREHPDPVEFVQRGVSHDAWRHRALLRFDCTAEELRRHVPDTAGRIDADGDDHAILRVGGEHMGWLVAHLGVIGHDFEVLDGDTLLAELRLVGERLLRAAGAGSSSLSTGP